MKKSSLIVLSIPLQRIIRSHLNSNLIDLYLKKSDLLVVSPFANIPSFSCQFMGRRVYHLEIPSYSHKNILQRLLYTITQYARWQGYWFRRRKKMPFYWKSRNIILGENGNDREVSYFKKIVRFIFAFVGYFPQTWKFIDSIHGWQTYKFPELDSIVERYEKIILIQSSSWGFQDELLSYWARRENWRKIFIPYTTDQLFSNGWLLCEYDKVCVQGDAEFNFAKKLYSVNNDRICKLGSLYGFVYKSFLTNRVISKSNFRKGEYVIMLAGSNPMFYPIDDEFYCLDLILNSITQGQLKNVQVIYRPLGYNKENRELILSRYMNRPNLEIKFANPSMYGLDDYQSVNFTEVINDQIASFSNIDLLVSCGLTSLSVECAYLGVPSIALNIHKSDFYKRRKLNLIMDSQKRFILNPSVPHISEERLLIPMIDKLLKNINNRVDIVSGINRDWNYENINLFDMLDSILYG
jgi:hypothetical protein